MENKICEVENCWDCNFLNQETYSHCVLNPNINCDPDKEVPPSECPLREGPITHVLNPKNYKGVIERG